MRYRLRSATIAAVAAWLVLLVTSRSAGAYDQFGNGCGNCHNITQGTTLHTLHQNSNLVTSAANRCQLCHIQTPGNEGGPVWTFRSRGNNNAPTTPSNRGCAGCHGAETVPPEKGPANDPAPGGPTTISSGYGLRQHHLNLRTPAYPAGVQVCATPGCHGASPNPLKESDKPVYYGRPDVVPTDPCNKDGKEKNWGGAYPGLDNDGDLLYDALDPDCQSGTCQATVAAKPGTATMCEGGQLTLSDNGSSCSNGNTPIFDWWKGPANGPTSTHLGTGSTWLLQGLTAGSYQYDLAVNCGACSGSLGLNLIQVTVASPPGVIPRLLATKEPNLVDARLRWTADANAGLYRVYSVDQKADLPPRGSNALATMRCFTPDGSTVTCLHAACINDGIALHHYQVVGTCKGDPTVEGPN